MVMMSPVSTTMNPAPAQIFTSFTVTVNPSGAPNFVGSSEKEYCVLAMHTGHPAKPRRVSRSICFFAAGSTVMSRPRYTRCTTARILSSMPLSAG